MKKVLIIGYFSPYRAGGSGRMLGITKYLPEFDWEPIVLTAPLDKKPEYSVRVIETGYPGDIFSSWRKIFKRFGFKTNQSITEQIKFKAGVASEKSAIDRLRTFYQELFAYPDTEKTWFKSAFEVADKLLSEEKIDAILSVWPITGHLVAKKLKEKHEVSWVADFPDPWSESHAYPYGKIRKFIDRRLEKKTLKPTNALTAAAPTYARKQEAVNNKKTETIFLGFDPKTTNEPPAPLLNKFTITYTGTIYKEHDPSKTLKALKNLINRKELNENEIEIRFFGPRYHRLNSAIKKLKLAHCVKQCKPVSRNEAIKKQRESHALLIFGWENKEKLGGIPLKMYEYFAARRPIIVTGGYRDEDLARIVTETGAGKHAPTIEEIESAVMDLIGEYRKNNYTEWRGKTDKIKLFSARESAGKFAKIFNSLTGQNLT